MDERDLAAALRGVLGPVTIEGLTRLSGGASRETWSFDAVGTGGSRTELVLRRDPPGRPSEPGAMSREARVIAAARAAGLAVPEVLLSTDEPDLWGTAGLVMRRVAGETIARRILRDAAYRQARTVLVRQVGEFAAGLHALAVPGYLPAPDPVASLRAELATFEQVSPVFELALRTLEADRPPARDTGDRPRRPAARQPHRRPGLAARGHRLGTGPRRQPGRGPRLVLRQGVAFRRRRASRRPRQPGRTAGRLPGRGRRRHHPWTSCAGGRYSARCAGASSA